MVKRTPSSRSGQKAPGRYHHGELRRALLDATLAIVRVGGSGDVSLSAAARKVGVSPQATYNHFKDKEDLLAAVAEETVRGLERAMLAARGAENGAGAALEATGVAYVRWAHMNAAQFRLLSAPELSNKARHPELLAAYDAAFAVLLGAIEDAQRAGAVRAGDRRKMGVAAWTMVHGLSWLLIDGQLTISGATIHDAEGVARDALRALWKGLRASS
jgi:AcrR family transcriptional regulator